MSGRLAQRVPLNGTEETDAPISCVINKESRKAMSASEHLGTYAEGWTKGDAGLILKAAAETYHNEGTILDYYEKQNINRLKSVRYSICICIK